MPVVAHTPAGMVRGIARTLDDGGALCVETGDGTVVRVIAGDVEVEREKRTERTT